MRTTSPITPAEATTVIQAAKQLIKVGQINIAYQVLDFTLDPVMVLKMYIQPKHKKKPVGEPIPA